MLFALAIIIAAYLLSSAVIDRNRRQGTSYFTELDKQNFTSDLLARDDNFTCESKDLKVGYTDLEKDRIAVTNCLKFKGIAEDQLVFNAVSTLPQYEQIDTA